MMRYHVLIACVLLMSPFATSQEARKDVVELKNGATFRGTILSETDAKVVIQFPGGTMALPRHRIKKVTRSAPPEAASLQRSLLTLSRFMSYSDHHFLYRDGKRVGYRTLSLRREAQEGIPGYQFHDRLVFASAPGAAPEVDLKVTEFVDAELRPFSFRTQVTSGRSGRVIEGKRVGEYLRMVETSGGSRRERSALFRSDTELPRTLMRRLATATSPEGGYGPMRVFWPREQDFGMIEVTRHLDRVSLRGHVKEVVVFRATSQGRTLETWMDLAGRVVREEIGSPHLISVRAPKADVLGWARGENVPDEDLGLEFVSEITGLRLLRPDQSWEMVPGTEPRKSLVTLLRPGSRATVDVFHLEDLKPGATEEGVALDLITRMEKAAEEVKVRGPEPGKVGERDGLRFEITCRRRGTRVTTRGGILLDGRRAFIVLCAAPTANFQDALPGFLEVMESVNILAPPESVEKEDPFQTAEKDR